MRKVGERRVCQDPTLAQTGLVCLAMLPLQKPFKIFSTCVSVVGQSVKRLRRMLPLLVLIEVDVSNAILVETFSTKYAHENMRTLPCPDFAGARKVRERAAKG